MGEWSFLSSLLDSVQEHSPMVGRFWLVVMLIFRILILATVGSDVFEDEQEEFVCNTLQPGCRQVCYNKAFPISHYRFWVFHIVLLSAPAVLFVIYSMHQNTKIAQEQGRAVPEEENQKKGLPCPMLQPNQRLQHIRNFYIVNVLLRILAEAGFLVGQWMLYGFWVEPKFICETEPCPHTVDCFVSRPTEKTIFVQFYFVVGIVSAVLSLAELAHLLFKDRCKKRTSATYEQENWSNREQEKSCQYLLQARPGRPGESHTLSNHYSPSAVLHGKPKTTAISSNKSSRSIARGDLTV
ncbi:gap junction delta-3 protein [Microcaecilia unicolor]|uniref:Gap junction protein n=1 Tax=Microcaecilia unicolor TaxID=1415580 RepID=A0A6P7ZD18_9AMPH|nr:gap junction delta-3 protein [Microcaecilia unicolor]